MTKTENQDGSVLASLFDEAKFNLEAALDNFLNSRVSDSLVYDGNLGGLVTTDGLLNSEADFGNGRYNDHHFHYGYILYACAIMGKIDPSFVDKYGSKVDAIYLDVAHGSNFDSKASVDGIFFPGARHKVWFDGHSYASGMFSFGNGKSMESSSESVNCYYGALLWSIVRNGKAQDPSADDSPETDFARLLLAMEIRGAKTYCEF
jgi:endo-1,3(4)-beta-glucanase